jgi:hypothetical protein
MAFGLGAPAIFRTSASFPPPTRPGQKAWFLRGRLVRLRRLRQRKSDKLLAQQILQRPAVTRDDLIAVSMSTVDDYFLTRTPYAVNQSATA